MNDAANERTGVAFNLVIPLHLQGTIQTSLKKAYLSPHRSTSLSQNIYKVRFFHLPIALVIHNEIKKKL